MQIYRWNEIERKQLDPLTVRQAIHAATMTIARFELRKGSGVAEHSHSNEQITTLLSGSVRFTVAGESVILRAGESVHVPPNTPHSVVVLEDSIAVDTFSPPRADWQ
jgi:quercetin dioxygenase-like cupin family protein